jgi:hypothetical protein
MRVERKEGRGGVKTGERFSAESGEMDNEDLHDVIGGSIEPIHRRYTA